MNKKLIVFIVVIVSIVFYLFAGRGRPSKDRILEEPQISSEAASANKLFDLAKSQESDNELLLSRANYQRILDEYLGYLKINNAQQAIERVNMKIVFSPSLITEQSKYYEVRPGDSLIKIARKFETTVELIMKINMIKSKVIHPKMRLKIWTGKFSVLVDKSQNILMLESNEKIMKTYTVATGKNNSTPVGTFKIINKLIDPVWFRREVGAIVPATSPDNILGSRWMGFDLDGYGIHGTTQPETIGKQVTDGCVRMKNEEVEELFSLLPTNTEVTIID